MSTHILVLCTHNSARSVLAEAMLRHLAAQRGVDVVAHSAGSAPGGRVHSLALQVLQDAGVATQGLHSKSWDRFAQAGGPPLAAVITVCDSAAAEPCPVFFGGPGQTPSRAHWGYPDPSRTEGSDEARRQAFDLTRQALGYRWLQLLAQPLATMDRATLQTTLDRLARA